MPVKRPLKIIPLKSSYYLPAAEIVAPSLLGKIFIRQQGQTILAAKIVETEAYLADNDPASHAYRGLSKRNRAMFEKGGCAYVYFIYGSHYCLNIVCGQKNKPSAVLIRAMEPVCGLQLMRQNRKKAKNDYQLTNGPGKICQAFALNKKFDGKTLLKESFCINRLSADKLQSKEIGCTERIGISRGKELKLRFFIKDNPYLSV